jgi:hypothetical protein
MQIMRLSGSVFDANQHQALDDSHWAFKADHLTRTLNFKIDS